MRKLYLHEQERRIIAHYERKVQACGGIKKTWRLAVSILDSATSERAERIARFELCMLHPWYMFGKESFVATLQGLLRSCEKNGLEFYLADDGVTVLPIWKGK